MASVWQQKKPDGGFYEKYRYTFKDYTGRRRTGTGTRRKAETEDIAQEVERRHERIRKGLEPPPNSAQRYETARFSGVVEQYLAWGKAQGGRGGRPWAEAHTRMRRAHLTWWADALELEIMRDLRGCLPRAEAALRRLRDRGRAGATVNNYGEALQAFCNWCVKRGYLDANPVEDMERFDNTPQETRRALTRDEVSRLLGVITPPGRRLTYETALCSGLRANELRSLKVRHLDTERGGLCLERAWTKSRKPGFQPLPGPLVERLAEAADGRPPDAPLLDVPSHPARDLKKDLRRAGVPIETHQGKLDFHALRVTYVTHLFDSGATVKEAQELARHSTPRLTVNVYAKTRPDRLHEVVGRMGQTYINGTKEHGGDQDGGDDKDGAAQEIEQETRADVCGTVSRTGGFRPGSAADDARQAPDINPLLRDSYHDAPGSPDTFGPHAAHVKTGQIAYAVHNMYIMLPPGLRRVARAWPGLPQATRQEMLKLLRVE